MSISPNISLESVLLRSKSLYSNILPIPLSGDNTFHLDLSTSNRRLIELDIGDNKVFEYYLSQKQKSEGARIPVGGYNEKRVLYRKSNHFGEGTGARDIHLGTDIWIDAGTPVSSPLDSLVHSFANNTNYRDYGPTIILQHILEGLSFYTLYGHLSIESLKGLFPGKIINSGEVFASIGDSKVNGSWPPHLHFQLIKEIGNNNGDYPGVASEEEREYYLNLCPDPDLILNWTSHRE